MIVNYSFSCAAVPRLHKFIQLTCLKFTPCPSPGPSLRVIHSLQFWEKVRLPNLLALLSAPPTPVSPHQGSPRSFPLSTNPPTLTITHHCYLIWCLQSTLQPLLWVFPLICKVLYNYYYKSFLWMWGNTDPLPRDSHCLLSGWSNSCLVPHIGWVGLSQIKAISLPFLIRHQAEKLASGCCPLVFGKFHPVPFYWDGCSQGSHHQMLVLAWGSQPVASCFL